MLKNYKVNYPNRNDVEYIKGLFTNGHDWALYEVHENYVKKTDFFRPKMPYNKEKAGYNGQNGHNSYMPKIFDDYGHLQAVIGLIRYAMSKFYIANIYTND